MRKSLKSVCKSLVSIKMLLLMLKSPKSLIGTLSIKFKNERMRIHVHHTEGLGIKRRWMWNSLALIPNRVSA